MPLRFKRFVSQSNSQSIAAFCIVVFDLSISLSELTALKFEFNRSHRYTSKMRLSFVVKNFLKALIRGVKYPIPSPSPLP